MSLKAIFFDRDGVVNQRIFGDYIKYVDEFVFKNDFLDLFEYISDTDVITLLVTNQQGIGKGIMTTEMLDLVHIYMQSELQLKCGKNFDKIYFCPDLVGSDSNCRKPKPGMIVQGLKDYKIDPQEAIMIGDSISDVVAGKKAGLITFLIGNPNSKKIPEADYIFRDLHDVKQFLIQNYF